MNELKELIGKPCRSIIGGKSTGSIISAGFGKEVLRSKPLNNPALNDFEKNYDFEYNLLVYCSWRIVKNDAIYFCWRDIQKNPTYTKDVFYELKDRLIENVIIYANPTEFDICFSGNFIFTVFSDISDPNESEENYIFYMPDRNIYVDFKGKHKTELKK